MFFFDPKIDFLFLCAHCTTLSSHNRIDVLMCALTQLDRDTIRRNEFGWVLQSKVADLASDDLLPPRFHDLAPSFASMNSITRSPKAEALSSAKSTMRTASGPALPEKTSASSSGAAAMESALEEEEEEEAAAAMVSNSTSVEGIDSEDATKRTLLRHWLESQLVECIAPQASCVAAGLREVVPYGILALFQPHELQKFLAGT